MSEWQKVFQDKQEYRAEIVKAVLSDNEIQAVLLTKKDSAYQFGHYEVLVSPDHVIRALKIINEDIRFE